MAALKVILLICAASVPRGDCTVDTADDVINGPDPVVYDGCGLQTQAYLAGTALAGRLDEDHYLKIVCGFDPMTRATARPRERGTSLAATPEVTRSD